MNPTFGQKYVDFFNQQESIKHKIPPIRLITKVQFNPLYTFELADEARGYVTQTIGWTNNHVADNLSPTALFAAYYWPDCPNPHRLSNLVKFIMILVLMDDTSENSFGEIANNVERSHTVWAQMDTALDRLLRNEPYVAMSSWRPYIQMSYAVLEDVCSELNQVSRQRLVDCFKVFMDGCMKEVEVMASGRDNEEFSVEELDQIRVATSAIHVIVVLSEYAYSVQITGEEWDDPLVQQIVYQMALITIYCNDLFSIEKEIVLNGGDIRKVANKNCVARIVVREGLSIVEAHNKVIQYFEESEQGLYDMERAYLSGDNRSVAMKRFLEGCRNVAMGTFVVCATCRRYTGFKGSPSDPYGLYF